MIKHLRKEILVFIFLPTLGLFTHPSLLWANLDSIETAILQEDYAKAESLARQSLKDNSLNIDQKNELNYYLGLSQLRLGRIQEAQNF